MIQEISSEEDIQSIVDMSSTCPVLVFKHSTRCGVSAYAWQSFKRFFDGNSEREVEYARVLVVEERSLSLLLEEKLGVMHQSPQLILVQNGESVWHESHYGITEAAITAALEDVEVR